MASSSTVPIGVMLGSPPATKLTRSNFLFWKTLVFPAIRGAMVMGLLEGTDRAPAKLISSKDANGKDISITNPAYATWMARDQAVVSYLLQSLSPELLPHVFGLETTEAVWNAITRMFSTASPAKVNALRGALNNTKKSSMTMAQFFAKMKGYASELVALGKTLDESELNTYLLNGLDGTYNDAIASANVQPGITVDELYDQLTAHDLRHSMLQDTGDSFTSSVNLVRRG
jgi:hypothetical protein